jgi:hypothetical protein
MRAIELEKFLTYPAIERKIAASTQNQEYTVGLVFSQPNNYQNPLLS